MSSFQCANIQEEAAFIEYIKNYIMKNPMDNKSYQEHYYQLYDSTRERRGFLNEYRNKSSFQSINIQKEEEKAFIDCIKNYIMNNPINNKSYQELYHELYNSTQERREFLKEYRELRSKKSDHQ